MDGSRGFGMGRGRGRGAGGGGLIGGIGAADRSAGAAGGVRTVGAGGGVGGRMHMRGSKASRRYPTDQLSKLYKQMLYAGRYALGLQGAGSGGISGWALACLQQLPACVKRDHPLLFLGSPTDKPDPHHLLIAFACRLRLPAPVERDDPLLFLGPNEFVDVVEQLMGVDPAEAAQAFAGAVAC